MESILRKKIHWRDLSVIFFPISARGQKGPPAEIFFTITLEVSGHFSEFFEGNHPVGMLGFKLMTGSNPAYLK